MQFSLRLSSLMLLLLSYWLAQPPVASAQIVPVRLNRVLYVDAAAPAGGNGHSWTTALNSLPLALKKAANTKTAVDLYVMAGEYQPADSLSVFAVPSDTRIFGGFESPNQITLHDRTGDAGVVLLNGDLNGSGDLDSADANNVITISGARNVLLDRLTVTGGNAVRRGRSSGAGILIVKSIVNLTDVDVTGNNAIGAGGGIFIAKSNVSITNNSAVGGGDVMSNSAGNGGGIAVRSSSVILDGLTLSHNSAWRGGWSVRR